MADNRTRKQDRKQIKILQKTIRRLEEKYDREVATNPEGLGSHYLHDLSDRWHEARNELHKLQEAHDNASEWDPRDEDLADRVARDRNRRECRFAKYADED